MNFEELVKFIRDYWPVIIAIAIIVTPVLWFILHNMYKQRVDFLKDQNELRQRKEVVGPQVQEPQRDGDAVQRTRKYDVFLSSVLAGFADASRLREEKEIALAVAKCLEQECNFSVYYAGREVQSAADFDRSHLGAKQDITALNDSRYFLLLYPERVASSVLFEAGFALKHCDASIYFVRNNGDLPYLMRRLPEAVAGGKTYTYQNSEEVLKVLKRHRRELFQEVAHSSGTA